MQHLLDDIQRKLADRGVDPAEIAAIKEFVAAIRAGMDAIAAPDLAAEPAVHFASRPRPTTPRESA